MKNSNEVHFGSMLRRAFDRSDYTQEQAAEKFGVARNNFANYFKKKDLNTVVLRRACEVFGVPMTYFFGFSDALPHSGNYVAENVAGYTAKLTQCLEENTMLKKENGLLTSLVDIYRGKTPTQ
ncbi:helix-turn-helix domain-containing protein [Salmonirosea aquatica]|uniref:HTH cro/C1-type domain-containing protein n=1 Tax=Salmonirosea aquatica TaxID=2654236 RepID=A0A7C9FZN1_9BACT|nr:hypothetical protein [Cytophagaceae bacterium SJW1-29]MPR37133.1 hypothetical protein [Cytophagaceae bacterium SJW1-29]